MIAKAHSRDLRSRFVALLQGWISASESGERLLVPRSTATRWGKQWRLHGRAEATPAGGDRRSHRLQAHAATILGLVSDKPDIFLREIAAALAKNGVTTSIDAVRRLLIRHRITRKKRR